MVCSTATAASQSCLVTDLRDGLFGRFCSPLPQLHSPIPRGAGKALTVWRKGQPSDWSAVAFEGSEVSAGGFLPEVKTFLADDFCGLKEYSLEQSSGARSCHQRRAQAQFK